MSHFDRLSVTTYDTSCFEFNTPSLCDTPLSEGNFQCLIYHVHHINLGSDNCMDSLRRPTAPDQVWNDSIKEITDDTFQICKRSTAKPLYSIPFTFLPMCNSFAVNS